MAEPEQEVKITIDDVLPKLLDRYISAEKEIKDMYNFQREAILTAPCDLKRCDLYPSKAIVKRYNLDTHNYSTMTVWWLMEQYFKGNLILKETV